MFVALVGCFFFFVWLVARRRLFVGRLRRDRGTLVWQGRRLPEALRRDLCDVVERSDYVGTLTLVREGRTLRGRARPALSDSARQGVDNVLGQYVAEPGGVRARARRSGTL